MKQYWKKLAAHIDAMSLRERIIILVMAVVVLAVLMNALLLAPLLAQQARLSRQLKQDEVRIAAVHGQMEALAQARGNDPEAVKRARLQALKQQLAQMDEALRGMQKGLVQPEKMALLLEDILTRNGRLQLVSLKTLPAGGIAGSGEKAGEPQKDKPAPTAAESALVYKHGVELVVRGGYADLLDYLTQLESLPWRMFWGGARLSVEEYPQATLTLTLYTLSLDKAWLSI